MRGHLIPIGVSLLVAAGCGGSRLIAGVELGSKLRPDDARFEATDGGQRKLRAPSRFERRQPTEVTVYLDDAGVIEIVEIQISVDTPEVAPLEDWSNRLCKKIGGEPESYTPGLD